MSKPKQQKFGRVDVVRSHKSGICDCGNSSYLKIKRKDARLHYCKNCARDSWIAEVENNE